MKRLFSIFLAFALLVVTYGAAYAGQPGAEFAKKGPAKKTCKTIRSGQITDTAGNPVKLGYDQFGYNYQAHLFNGTYDSSDRVLDGKYWGATGDYVDDRLAMKWSDSWLSNKDCNGDGKLDRGLVKGVVWGTSRGWLTNHVNGEYFADGASHHYTDFVKIVWVGPGGDLWNEFTIVKEVYNDPYGGNIRTQTDPGLGQHK